MAQLVPGLVLVVLLLFIYQLAAAEWENLFAGFTATSFENGKDQMGFDMGQTFPSSSPPNPPAVGGNSSGNTNCSTPTSGISAPLRWTDEKPGYVVELGISGTANAYGFLVSTANNFVWTDQCPSFPASAALVRQACNSQQCGLLKTTTSPCNDDPQCRYVTIWMDGYLTNSSFTLTNSKPFNLSFGCNNKGSGWTGFTRVAGMGLGPLSLTSQLQVSKFSYCFPNYGNESISSQIFFGSHAVFDEGTKSVVTTPLQLIANRYSINLTEILVGQTPVGPFPATQVVIDTSTPLTYLETPVYTSFRNTILNIMNLEPPNIYHPPYDMCFDLSLNAHQDMPEITFNFGGARINFPMRNYLFRYADYPSGSVFCFAIMQNVDTHGYSFPFSILGNFQQQNIQFIYDLQNMTLSFGSVDCSMLQSRKDDTSVSCERTSSAATSNGAARVELGGRVAATLPFLFFFYYLFVPFLLI